MVLWAASVLGAIAPIRHWVVAGRGVAVLPEYFIARDLEEGRLQRVLTHVEPRRTGFVWSGSGITFEPAVSALGRFLADQPLR